MKSRFGLVFVFLLFLFALLAAPASAEGPSEVQRAAGRELAKRIAAAVERYPLGDVTGWFETLGVGEYTIGRNRNLIFIYAGGQKYNFEYPLAGEGGVSVEAVVFSVAKHSPNHMVEIILNNNIKTCLTADDLMYFFSPIRPPQYFKGRVLYSPSAAEVVPDRNNLPDIMRFSVSSGEAEIYFLNSIRYFEGYSCLRRVTLTYVG